MNENMMRNDPPHICDTYECANDAHVALFSAEKGWFHICPSCLDELNRLHAGITLPEQRAQVAYIPLVPQFVSDQIVPEKEQP